MKHMSSITMNGWYTGKVIIDTVTFVFVLKTHIYEQTQQGSTACGYGYLVESTPSLRYGPTTLAIISATSYDQVA